jgi:uncharacterized cupredoxin-like copper-binding protein
MQRRALLLAAAFAAATIPAACSSDDAEPSAGAETITVQMTDNQYSPTSFDVEEGETVTFEFVNEGRMTHEAYIGDAGAQEDHATEMMGDDGHSMDMGGDDTVTVEPGETATMTHTFDETGTVIIGCHQPGHWESGMKAMVNVG